MGASKACPRCLRFMDRKIVFINKTLTEVWCCRHCNKEFMIED